MVANGTCIFLERGMYARRKGGQICERGALQKDTEYTMYLFILVNSLCREKEVRNKLKFTNMGGRRYTDALF